MNKIAMAMTVFVAGSLQGAIIDYRDAASVSPASPGNVIARTNGLFTVSASGWSAGSAGTSMFTAASLNDYGTAGLGVCTISESSGGCSGSGNPSEHQLDNTDNHEFVMFQFSSSTSAQVNVTNLQVLIGSLAIDYDVSYWLGNTSNTFNLGTLNAAGLAAAGFAARVDISSVTLGGADGNGWVNVNIGNLTGYNTLIFGPSVNQTTGNDGFKLKQISFTNPSGTGTGEGVPEPGTYALMGAGLLGLGYWRRKKT